MNGERIGPPRGFEEPRRPVASVELRAWAGEQALDAVSTGVVVDDATGAVLYANPAAVAMLGVGRSTLDAGTECSPEWSVVDEHGRTLTPAELPLHRCLETRRALTGAVIGVRRPDGGIGWLRIDARPLQDDAGRVRAVTLVFDDISEQRAVAAELARSEERVGVLRTAAGVGLWEWDLERASVWHDDVVAELVGRTIDDPPALLRTFGVEDGTVTGLMRLSGDRSRPTKIVGADGRVRWVVLTAERTGTAGTSGRISGCVVDVSELHAADAQVHELLDSMTDGYFSLMPDWTVERVSLQGAALLGRTVDELRGKHIWHEFPDAVGTEFDHHYERAMRGAHVEFEAYYSGLDAWYVVRARPLPGGGIAVHFRDVTADLEAARERERLLARAETAQVELAHEATHDALTGLPNRRALTTRLAKWVATGQLVAALFIDLDRFKLVNDSHGHTVGDDLLRQVGARLASSVRPRDMVARLGGDEFVIALACSSVEEVDQVAGRALAQFAEPFSIAGREFAVTASVGVAVAEPGDTPETLVRNADAALYRAKDAGRNRVVTFDDAMWSAVVRRVALETELRDALGRGDIVVHFQPIFDLHRGRPCGAEALARWTGSTFGPDEFIPIAEETGLIHRLGAAVLTAAVSGVDVVAPDTCAEDRVWVNVSGRQLNEPTYASDLICWAAELGATHRIGIEITESVLADDTATTVAALRRLADAGFRIAIDDFGTGYSSLARLAKYPVHMLKIDRSFLAELGTTAGTGIVAAIVDLAHALGAAACAEGIETPAQLAAMRDLGVDRVSGYLLARPVPIDGYAASLTAGVARLGAHDAMRAPAGALR